MNSDENTALIEARFREGQKLLDSFIGQNSSLPTSDLFRKSWHVIVKNKALFEGVALLKNRFDIEWDNLVYFQFCRFFEKLRPDFVPPIRIDRPDVSMDEFCGSTLVTVHNLLEMAIGRALQKIGLETTFVSSAGIRLPGHIRLFRFAPAPLIIPRDRNCMLLMRDAVQLRRALIVDVDYTLYDPEAKMLHRRIGINSFEFSKKTRTPLHYVFAKIDVEGEIVIHSRKANSEDSAGHAAQEFIRFLTTNDFRRGPLSVGDWFADTGGKPNAILKKYSSLRASNADG